MSQDDAIDGMQVEVQRRLKVGAARLLRKLRNVVAAASGRLQPYVFENPEEDQQIPAGQDWLSHQDPTGSPKPHLRSNPRRPSPWLRHVAVTFPRWLRMAVERLRPRLRQVVRQKVPLSWRKVDPVRLDVAREGIWLRQLSALAALLFALFSTVYLAVIQQPWTGVVFRSCSALTAAAIIAVLALPRKVADRDGENAPGDSIGSEDIKQSIDHVLESYGKVGVSSFCELLPNLPSYLSRIHEKVEIQGRLLRVSRTLQFRIGDKLRKDYNPDNRSPQSLLVPLVIVQKGKMFDRLSVFDKNGHKVPIIGQWELHGLLALALDALLTQARRAPKVNGGAGQGRTPGSLVEDQQIIPGQDWCGHKDPAGFPNPHDPAPEDGYAELWMELLTKVICANDSRAPADPIGRGSGDEQILPRILALPHNDRRYLEHIETLCRRLATNTILVVEIPFPVERHVLLTYESLHEPHSGRFEASDKLRARFGQTPRILEIPMTGAFYADSYHLDVAAPRGSYVIDCRLKESAVHAEPMDTVIESNLYHSTRRDDSGSTAHVYFRRKGRHRQSMPTSGKFSTPGLRSIVTLREIPPGAVGNAATLAWLTSMMVLFFALAGVKIGKECGSAGSLAALFFAIPAFAGSTLGIGVDSDKIGRSLLSAHVGLRIMSIIAILSAMLYLYDVKQNHPTMATLHLSSARFVRTDLLWLPLLCISVMVAGYLSIEKANARRHYLGVLEKASQVN
jgi:hypothetical protein